MGINKARGVEEGGRGWRKVEEGERRWKKVKEGVTGRRDGGM